MFALLTSILSTFIIVCVTFSVSVGLMVTIVGFALFYLFCELTLFLARIDLFVTYFMVEDNPLLLKKPASILQIPLLSKMPSCSLCCHRCFSCFYPRDDSSEIDITNNESNNSIINNTSNNNNKFSNMTFCTMFTKRIKTLYTSCRMYLIIIYFLIIKPIVTLVTCWTVLLTLNALYLMIFPLWFLINNHQFVSNQVCVFGYSSCDSNNVCGCHGGMDINSFGMAMLAFFIGLFALPLTLQINNWSACLAKIVSYRCLTEYYEKNIDDQNNNHQLLSENDV